MLPRFPEKVVPSCPASRRVLEVVAGCCFNWRRQRQRHLPLWLFCEEEEHSHSGAMRLPATFSIPLCLSCVFQGTVFEGLSHENAAGQLDGTELRFDDNQA